MSNKFNVDYLISEVTGKKSTANLDNFKNTANIFEKSASTVDSLPIDKLIPYSKHPFQIRDNEYIQELVESIKENGMLNPLIVRVHSEKRGYYEILAGHHRHLAGERAELIELPCVIRNVDDDTAALIVVESNKQRGFSDMLPSEIAKALKLEHEARKRQGKRNDLVMQLDEIISAENTNKCYDSEDSLTSGTMCRKLNDNTQKELSERSIRYYIRLINLIEPLLNLVDKNTIAIRPAVDLSYLSDDEQKDVMTVIEEYSYTVDMKKSAKLKEYSQAGKINIDTVRLILSGGIFEVKQKKITSVNLPVKKIKEYIPSSLSSDGYEEYIIEALQYYSESKEAKNEFD